MQFSIKSGSLLRTTNKTELRYHSKISRNSKISSNNSISSTYQKKTLEMMLALDLGLTGCLLFVFLSIAFVRKKVANEMILECNILVI